MATLAYEDINHPKVELFRNFRDKYLINFFLGRLFIKKYYKYSPNLVVFLRPYKSVSKFIRFGLDLLLKLIPTN
ncbi:CFI-box-CTERM domain-containing protein [Flavobacterium sp.]|uniref:CFI-box-CTERM domain-containing protein n=1 Tax=Flavobacterium sp. TaxID=239 RepID=UPI00345BB3FB